MQVLEWSGVPTVNVRAAIFVENPILTWLALEPLGNGELRLPFGAQRFAPIAGYDVAELCVKILIDPAPHISKSYEVTGPELKDMHEFAADYAAVLGRQVTYVPEDVETWNEQYVDSALAAYPHIAEYIKDLTRLVAGGRYGAAGVSEQWKPCSGARRRPCGGRWRTIRACGKWLLRATDRPRAVPGRHTGVLRPGTPVRLSLRPPSTPSSRGPAGMIPR